MYCSAASGSAAFTPPGALMRSASVRTAGAIPSAISDAGAFRTFFAHVQADGGAVTLIQRFASAANLHIHLHCLVLDRA